MGFLFVLKCGRDFFLEIVKQPVIGLGNVLRDSANPGCGCHEIMVPVPSGDNMKMQMLCKTCTSRLPEIKADIEAIGLQVLTENRGAGFQHFHKSTGFIAVQAIKSCHVANRGEEKMAVGIREPVEQDNGYLVPEKDQ